jgi:ERG2 and Sigma1 receptor like protein
MATPSSYRPRSREARVASQHRSGARLMRWFVAGVVLAIVALAAAVLDAVKVRVRSLLQQHVATRVRLAHYECVSDSRCYPFKERWYIFDPSELHSVVQRSLAGHPNDTRAAIDGIVSSLRDTHPEHAISQTEEWIFSNAGGALGAVYIIHASITECVHMAGSHTGRENFPMARQFLTRRTHAGISLYSALRSAQRDTRADTRQTTTFTSSTESSGRSRPAASLQRFEPLSLSTWLVVLFDMLIHATPRSIPPDPYITCREA